MKLYRDPGMLVYDKPRAEIVDAETGLVVEERIIDHGPEWRSFEPGKRRCHVMYRRLPEELWFFRGLLPRYIVEDAGYIMARLGLRGRAAALAAILYSSKRWGVPVDGVVRDFIDRAGVRRVRRIYVRIVEALGPPPRMEDVAVAWISGLTVKLGKPRLAPLAVRIYRDLRRRHQGYRSSTLIAVALVKTGFPARTVSRATGVSPSTLFKALKIIEGGDNGDAKD